VKGLEFWRDVLPVNVFMAYTGDQVLPKVAETEAGRWSGGCIPETPHRLLLRAPELEVLL